MKDEIQILMKQRSMAAANRQHGLVTAISKQIAKLNKIKSK